MLRSRTLLPAVLFILSTALAGILPAAPLGEYWYRGEAELTSYTLEQARYGEVHPGHAVLIFVTEDFSRSKQVKLDAPARAGADATKVLKLNFTKKFTTGVYPYSMMTSVFTPIDDPGVALKVTTSSQEWCGHSFTQLNRTEGGYRVTEQSYFESEGDRTVELDGALTEDALWTQIRIDPQSLPTGPVRLIPGTKFQRLSHQPWRVADAEASLTRDEDDSTLSVYTVTYPSLRRTLSIRFRTAAPHEIESFEESSDSGRSSGGGRLVTRGTRNKRIMLDYWNRHDLADAKIRARLGLD